MRNTTTEGARGKRKAGCLAHDLGEVGLGGGDGTDVVVIHQHLKDPGAHEGRERGTQVDPLDAQVEQGEQDADGLLLVPGEHHGQRQVVHAALERLSQSQRNLDGAVGVIALSHVKQARNAADIAKVKVVETVLAARQGQDDGAGRRQLGEVGVVAALLAHAVAARKQDEALDVSGLDRVDDGRSNAHDGIVAKAGGDAGAAVDAGKGSILIPAAQLKRLVDQGGEVLGAVFASLDDVRAGEAHRARGEDAVGIGGVGLHQAVGGPQNGRGKVRELPALVVPGSAVVALQMGVLAQLGIGVGGKHLAVSVDVDAAALGLLQQLLQVVQVVASHHDEGACLDFKLHRRRCRLAVGGDVGVLKGGHGGKVDLAALQDQRQQLVHTHVGTDGTHALIEKRVHGGIGLAQRLGMEGVCRHAAHAEEQQALQTADVFLGIPYAGHVVSVELAHGDGLGADAAGKSSNGAIVEAHVAHAGEHALQHEGVGLGVRARLLLRAGQCNQRPRQLVLQLGDISGLATNARRAGAGSAARGLLALEAEHLLVSHFGFLHQGWCLFEVTALYCGNSFISVVEPTGIANGRYFQ